MEEDVSRLRLEREAEDGAARTVRENVVESESS